MGAKEKQQKKNTNAINPISDSATLLRFDLLHGVFSLGGIISTLALADKEQLKADWTQ